MDEVLQTRSHAMRFFMPFTSLSVSQVTHKAEIRKIMPSYFEQSGHPKNLPERIVFPKFNRCEVENRPMESACQFSPFKSIASRLMDQHELWQKVTIWCILWPLDFVTLASVLFELKVFKQTNVQAALHIHMYVCARLIVIQRIKNQTQAK